VLYFLYKLSTFLALKIPLKISYRIVTFFSDIFCIFAKSDRRNMRANLEIVLGTHDKKEIRRCTREVFRNFVKYLIDFVRFSKLSKAYILNCVKVEGRENLDKALSKGKGAIMLSAHLGNWEMGGAIVAKMGYSLYVIALDHKDKRINNFFLKQRACTGVNVIPAGSLLKSCFKVLKKNCLLAIVADRDFSEKGGLEVTFFGKRAMLPKGPSFFSMRTGAPTVPVFCLREKDDSFRFVFEKAIEAEFTDNPERDKRRFIEEYTHVMERYIRKYADQWCVFRKMWPEQVFK